jgi:transposase
MSLGLQSLLPYPNSCLGASPHQQGRGTKMLSFCGIDVSKDRLDVMVLPEQRCSSVPNDAAGWTTLVEQLRGFSIAAVGIEASGGYERGVVRSLQAAGMSVRQVNPFKLRQFARASGVLAKNDPLDARMIASFVGVMPTRPAQQQTPAAERLAEMLAVRRQLSAEKVAAENASRLLEDAMLRRLSRRRIGRLIAEIKLLDKCLVEIVATDPALTHRYRLITSMPGVGPVLACTLIALLPELGSMNRKQVAALVGVAPYAFESGTLKGRRCIWGGRANVRQVLYMAAMSASNWNSGLKAFHDRLKAIGKKPKVAIVAVMRKMITTLNAMVRDDVVWADRHSGRHSVTTAR